MMLHGRKRRGTMLHWRCPQQPKWLNANKKCMAFIKNTIENAIAVSIEECTSVGEFLEKIKSQFSGSSKVYAT
jgi:hypothetical protein